MEPRWSHKTGTKGLRVRNIRQRRPCVGLVLTQLIVKPGYISVRKTARNKQVRTILPDKAQIGC